MNTSPAETSAADAPAPAPALPTAEPSVPSAPAVPASAEQVPAPAVKRARGRVAAPKPVEVTAVESAPVAVSASTAKRAPRKTGAAVKAAVPVARKPVRKVAAAAAGDGAAGAVVAKGAPSVKAARAETSRKRDKLVRDSFTMPKSEYALLADLKQRATTLARPAKKSELLRAGIKALAAMGDTAFLAALYDVPALKTGRPAAQEVPSHKAKAGKTGERRGS